MKYFHYLLAIFVGFVITLYGSLDLTSGLQNLIYGPYPLIGEVPFVRKVTDVGFSVMFTVLGGYTAAHIASGHFIRVALLGGLAYFCLSAYWYSEFNMPVSLWFWPAIMLIKVPVGAYLGGWLYQEYGAARATVARA